MAVEFGTLDEVKGLIDKTKHGDQAADVNAKGLD